MTEHQEKLWTLYNAGFALELLAKFGETPHARETNAYVAEQVLMRLGEYLQIHREEYQAVCKYMQEPDADFFQFDFSTPSHERT